MLTILEAIGINTTVYDDAKSNPSTKNVNSFSTIGVDGSHFFIETKKNKTCRTYIHSDTNIHSDTTGNCQTSCRRSLEYV